MATFYDDRESELVEHIRQLDCKLKVAEERIINLQQSDMTHEYNNAEAARVWPQIKEQIEEPFKDFISRTIIHLERVERFDLVREAKELINQGEKDKRSVARDDASSNADDLKNVLDNFEYERGGE